MTKNLILSSYKARSNKLIALPVEMSRVILEQCDVATLQELHKISIDWYHLTNIEIFKRYSKLAIVAQKSILQNYLKSHLAGIPQSALSLNAQTRAQIKTVYFTKNPPLTDSGLTALMAAAVLIFNYEPQNILTPLQRQQLRHDILLTALDKSAYKHTLLAFQVLFGKERLNVMAITATTNIVAESKVHSDEIDNPDESDSDYCYRIDSLKYWACKTIEYLVPSLSEGQMTFLTNQLIKMIADEEFDRRSQLPCNLLEAIASKVPNVMIKRVINVLHPVIQEDADWMQEYFKMLLIFIPRLSVQEFQEVLTDFQADVAEQIKAEEYSCLDAINQITEITSVASQEQLEKTSDILYAILVSAIMSPKNDHCEQSCDLLCKLMGHNLFNTRQCNALVNMLMNKLYIETVADNPATPTALVISIYNALAACALGASKAQYDVAMMLLKNYQVCLSVDVQKQVASHMTPEQLEERISAYARLLSNENTSESAITLIGVLASHLPTEVIANSIKMLQQDLLNPESHSASLFYSEEPQIKDAVFTCKCLLAMVHLTSIEQAPALIDTLINTMRHGDPKVRSLAIKAAEILALTILKEQAGSLIDAIAQRIFDNSLCAQAIETLTKLAAYVSPQQLATIIPRMLTANLIVHQNKAIHTAAANFFLAFAQQVPLEDVTATRTQLYASHYLYGASLTIDNNRFEPVRLTKNETHNAEKALIALLSCFTAMQINDFIEPQLQLLAIETPPLAEQQNADPDWRDVVLKTLLSLDILTAIIKVMHHIPSRVQEQLLNRFDTKMTDRNLDKIRHHASTAMLELLVHQVPRDDLPLFLPHFLEHAIFSPSSFSETEKIINAINALIPRLHKADIQLLMEPLQRSLVTQLNKEAYLSKSDCAALFAINNRRTPDEQAWPERIWDNPHSIKKFPFLFQLIFKQYQQAVNDLMMEQQTDLNFMMWVTPSNIDTTMPEQDSNARHRLS